MVGCHEGGTRGRRHPVKRFGCRSGTSAFKRRTFALNGEKWSIFVGPLLCPIAAGPLTGRTCLLRRSERRYVVESRTAALN